MKRRRKTAPARARVTREELIAEIEELRDQLAAEQATREAEQVALIEAQQELEASSSRYGDLYDFAPVGYITLSRAGVIRDINLAGANLLDSDRSHLLGKPLLPMVAKADRRNFQNYLLRLQKKPEQLTAELSFEGKTSGLRLLHLTSIISSDRSLSEVHFRTIISDITERKQTELSLVRLNETMLAMLEAIPDIFYVVGPGGNIRFRNQAASRFMQATELEDMPSEIRVELGKVLSTGEHSLPTDLKKVHRFVITHEERFFLSRIVCLLGSESEALGAVVMLQDVTGLRMLDEVKTGLISTVSHELKTPITSVRTALMVLLEQTFGSLNAKQTELLSLARDEGERLLHTLDTLLDLTRFESNAMEMRTEQVKPKDLVRAAVTVVWSTAVNAHIRIKSEVEARLPLLTVDRERILHVLTNFLTNAIKYSPAASEITVRARCEERGVCFSVQDQGPGVPEEYRSRIFEKFFRVPGLPAQGAGLGLSIAREFVRVHGGQIGLRSEPGRGSEFYFVLPLKRP